MTLDELKQKATATELVLILHIEKLVLETEEAKAARVVERDLEPAKKAASLMKAILKHGNVPDRHFDGLIGAERYPFRDSVVEAANRFFDIFPELRDET